MSEIPEKGKAEARKSKRVKVRAEYTLDHNGAELKEPGMSQQCKLRRCQGKSVSPRAQRTSCPGFTLSLQAWLSMQQNQLYIQSRRTRKASSIDSLRAIRSSVSQHASWRIHRPNIGTAASIKVQSRSSQSSSTRDCPGRWPPGAH